MTKRVPLLVCVAALTTGVLTFGLVLTGCEDEPPITVGAPPPATPAPAAATDPNAADGGVEEDAGELTIDAGPLSDDMFVESENNRDPFRNFGKRWRPRVTPTALPTRNVIMSNLSVDQMRLMAIISGVTAPMAMILDSTGLGHMVHRGDYIGQAEVVQMGGEDGLQMQVNWRIERIRSDEVVLVRDDPNNPGSSVTRVLALYPEGDPARGTGWSGGYIPPAGGAATPGAPGSVPPGGFGGPGAVPPGGYVAPGGAPAAPSGGVPPAGAVTPTPVGPPTPTGGTPGAPGAGGIYTIPVVTPPPAGPATP